MTQQTKMPEPVAYMHVSRYTDRKVISKRKDKPNLQSKGFISHGLITTDQAEAYVDARVRESLEAFGAGGVSGQRITKPPTDEAQSAWFAGIDAGREIERHNSQLDNCGLI